MSLRYAETSGSMLMEYVPNVNLKFYNFTLYHIGMPLVIAICIDGIKSVQKRETPVSNSFFLLK